MEQPTDRDPEERHTFEHHRRLLKAFLFV